MNGETLGLLRSSLARLLREVSGRDLVGGLADLGWEEVSADDPETSTRLLFEAQGRALVSSSALDSVILCVLRPVLSVDPLGGDHAVLHPYPESQPAKTPGVLGPKHNDLPDLALSSPGLVSIRGLILSGLTANASLVVPVTAGGSVRLFMLDDPAEHLEVSPVGGVAPEMQLTQASGTVEIRHGRMMAEPDTSLLWREATAAAQRALAHELTGVSGLMLDIAVDHATERVQFGRPIGTFQAVQQRLAECHVAVEAARTAAVQAGETGASLASATAKALAGNAARITARHCQQVLGAIGFTWDHPFHYALRRGMALELLYGSTSTIQQELGHAISESDQPFRQLVAL